jgi:hypothetical protein
MTSGSAIFSTASSLYVPAPAGCSGTAGNEAQPAASRMNENLVRVRMLASAIVV